MNNKFLKYYSKQFREAFNSIRKDKIMTELEWYLLSKAAKKKDHTLARAQALKMYESAKKIRLDKEKDEKKT